MAAITPGTDAQNEFPNLDKNDANYAAKVANKK